MPTRQTAKRSSALACVLATVLAAGCGGGGAKSTSSGAAASAGTTTSATTTSPLTGVELARACAPALEALGNYRTATAKAGLKFNNPAVMNAAKTAAGELRSRVQQLRASSGGTQAAQLDALAAALAQQEIVLEGIVRGDFKTAGEHAKGLNEGLSTGLANLRRMCTGL
jgi:hypothetical protein